MKKIKKVVAMMLATTLLTASIATLASAGERKWTCSRYYNGNYEGYAMFWASSYSEAMAKAIEFYKNYTYTSIKCE